MQYKFDLKRLGTNDYLIFILLVIYAYKSHLCSRFPYFFFNFWQLQYILLKIGFLACKLYTTEPFN